MEAAHPLYALPSALCSTPAQQRSWASVWRDALCPDTYHPAWRAAEGKGDAAWHRDRTRAQPRTAPAFGREHGEHGENPPLARSEHRGISLSRKRGGFIHSVKFNFS